MKKLVYYTNSRLLIILIAAAAFLLQGCKKDASSSTGIPAISAIRNYVAHPGDSLLSSAGTGQWIVISGKNLKGALHINIDGVAASFNDAWFSDTSAIVLIPAVIAFPSVPSSKLNTIEYITIHGQTTFSFPIVAPAPTISGISNESANVGDSVKINGFSFFFIKNVTFAGKTITDYTASNDGTTITLAVPSGITTGGPVSVTTATGSVTTVYNVEDFVSGVFCNFDAINTYPWGSGTSNSSYPGNTGYFDVMGATNLPAGGTDWYDYPHSINLNASQWVPASDIAASLDSYAVKFEINVTKPWSNGTIYILANYNFSNMAAYNPWKNADGSKTPFTTKGWQTVTIPLSNFIVKDGVAGLPPASIAALTGASGNTGMEFMFMNYTKDPVVLFEAAIDNIRVVKIK
ncbi:hypothetical protein SAMN05216464_101528 [Mucilaginibacter pineti]|uniref:Surface glycan-binding protein B xyloglucan binding domain-containing protein n=1 Tax=Mucilaginibacter pineti TaxID=1391627 RepID=A0A1G6U6N1_9SPHI|nr:glycan-binding surface protein [Mucilaginibacter pineti]SDD36205.1 hypothetical protein SAMN05216464_101528 [Mucilaginibacter pineti]